MSFGVMSETDGRYVDDYGSARVSTLTPGSESESAVRVLDRNVELT